MLRYLTAGESHGKMMVATLEGMPSGLSLNEEDVNQELRRRQMGYGRGKRMSIEKDKVEVTSGIRWGKTIGSPITLIISNKDWENWTRDMSIHAEDEDETRLLKRPRPGHADLAGALKYNHRDIRNVLERSSARETCCRVAVGAVCKKLLSLFRIRIYSYVIEIGDVKACNTMRGKGLCADASDLRCLDPEAEIAMKDCIDKAHTEGDTLGGIFEVVAEGVPVGLGSHTHWDRKLDTRLSAALMSIQAIKGVEIGMGFDVARHPGSQVHDEIFYGRKGSSKKSTFYRKTNRAGGIEGGTSNGEDIILRAAMKPISTLRKPLRSVDIDTKDELTAIVERSDVCAVPACSVIGEAVVAFEIARAFVEKFGGDSIEEIQRNYDSYMKYLDRF